MSQEAIPREETAAGASKRRLLSPADNPLVRAVGRVPAGVHVKLLVAFVGTALLVVVLGVLGLRFANRLFEPLMSAEHIERVEVVFEEQLGLEGRAGYYDRAGALTDMVQSHLLLVLALVAMEVPSDLSSEVLRGDMVQLLRAVRPWKHDGTASRRAR